MTAMDGPDVPEVNGPRLGKGPAEVLRALVFGDADERREALDFQREAFRSQFGCYPEECQVIPYEELPPDQR